MPVALNRAESKAPATLHNPGLPFADPRKIALADRKEAVAAPVGSIAAIESRLGF